jgi:hypothetical protein
MRPILGLLLLTAACVDSDRMLERDELAVTEVEPLPAGAFATFIDCVRDDDFVASKMASVVELADLKQRMYVQLRYFRYDRVNDVVDVNETTMESASRSVADATYDLYQRTQTRLASGTCR